MKDLFFYKIYRFDKRLFFLLATFTVITVACNIKGDELTPFFIWAMYSEKENPVNQYRIYKIRVNDSIQVDYSSGYTDNNRFFLTGPLSLYHKMLENNRTDPTRSFIQEKLGSNLALIGSSADKVLNSQVELDHFLAWYKRYLEQCLSLPVDKFTVSVVNARFNDDQLLQTESSVLISWKQQ